MSLLEGPDIAGLFLAIGVLLGTALLLGELAKRVGQPAVVGEIFAGILLGPTILGNLWPEANAFLFPRGGTQEIALDGLVTVAVALFLLVAGMEVDLSRIWRQGASALSVSTSGLIVPFALGFVAAWIAPDLLGWEQRFDPVTGVPIGADPVTYALFVGAAMSISAVPVIAKVLMDLKLFRTDMGMVLIAAAIFHDLIGWIIFAVVLATIGAVSGPAPGIGMTVGLTLGFAGVMLTLGRWTIHRALPWIQAHTAWPGGVLSFALALAFFAAAFTEWLGVHAIFGAFIVGVALGDSSHLREQTRFVINQFINFVFAPLFVAVIGLKVDFAANFDVLIVLAVLAVACAGKIFGCAAGARLSGVAPREAWALGFGLNARGEMGIILGLLALQAAVISERMFVALVVMAILTSMGAGPLMERVLKRKKPKRFGDFLSAKAFVHRLKATDRRLAIRELAGALAGQAGVDATLIEDAVWAREQIMSTGLGQGVATPHARLEQISTPAVAVGMSGPGIDFNAADGEPAHIIVMLVTPTDDGGAQLELLADVARTFVDPQVVARALKVAGHIEFRALIKQTLQEQG